MIALIGKKLGMSHVFDGAGRRVPVTRLQAGPCVVTQRKTKAVDGYDAVQIGFGDIPERKVDKPLAGHFKKAGVSPKRVLREIETADVEKYKAGDVLTVSVFAEKDYVDVAGNTKGRGFQGVVKRHGMRGGPSSHGSMSHRRMGAVGMRASPGRILKGKRMPGHMGDVRVTGENLLVVGVNEAENLLLVRGSVPGANGGIVFVRKSLKKVRRAS